MLLEDATIISKYKKVKFVDQDVLLVYSTRLKWGLDRIDQEILPLNGDFSEGGVYGDNQGAGVTAYY